MRYGSRFLHKTRNEESKGFTHVKATFCVSLGHTVEVFFIGGHQWNRVSKLSGVQLSQLVRSNPKDAKIATYVLDFVRHIWLQTKQGLAYTILPVICHSLTQTVMVCLFVCFVLFYEAMKYRG